MAQPPTSPLPDTEIDWTTARALMRERIAAQMGSCEPDELEDLTQEGLIQLHRLARRETPRNLGGVITVVARSVAIDEIRRRQRRRRRFAEWDSAREQAEQAPSPPDQGGETELLWFLMLEFFRRHKAACLTLAQVYSEHGNWRNVAENVGRGYEAVRQQWARCTRVFREALRRNPGPFQDWMDEDA